MFSAYLLFGSNLGDRELMIARAVSLLGKRVVVEDGSKIYKSAAWGIEDQPAFLNQVARIQTDLTPRGLLKLCLKVEGEMGRERKQKWGERLIDVDILYYEDWVIEETDLAIPHPGIPDRRFTLVPLCDLAPHKIHPVLHKSNQELLRDCKDPLTVEPYLTTDGVA